MTYIKGTDISNLIKCNHCNSIIGYDMNDIFVEKAISYSLEILENKEVVFAFIHCPCCGSKIKISEVNN